MRLTGNPGGPGHSWVKQRYIDPNPAGYEILKYTDSVNLPSGEVISVTLERVFIPSKLRDNPKLLVGQPTYVLQLRQTGSEQLVKAWLDGDWNSIEGAYFSDFSYEKHVLPQSFEQLIPKHWTRFRAFDWGSAKPFCVGWYAIADGKTGPPRDGQPFPKGAIIKYREWYGWNGKPNEGLKMSASAVGRGILELDKMDLDKGLYISYALADPSIFAEDGGPSIGEMMLGAGCRWERADNKRIPGWEQIHMRLQAPVPLLYFLDSCEHTIRTIELLQHDDTRPEDIDTEMEDHAMDETRYACNSRPLVSHEKEQAEVWDPDKPQGLTFMQLVNRNTARRRAAESY